MQAATIRPAQLMMEFMAGEQEKTSQAIRSQEFTKQLEEQQLKANPQPQSLPEIIAPPRSRAVLHDRPRQAPVKDRASQDVGSIPAKTADGKRSKLQQARSQATEAKPTRQWKTAQELQVTDSMTLDKVLQELQVPPDLREALKNNSGLNGTISLQQLSTLLDQALQEDTTLSTEGKVSAADVRSLLSSLQSPQNNSTGLNNAIQLKAGGFYTLPELRQVLRQVVEQNTPRQVADNSVKLAGTPREMPSPAPVATPSPSGSATGKLTSQPETAGIFLARSLLDDSSAAANTNSPSTPAPPADAAKVESALGAPPVPRQVHITNLQTSGTSSPTQDLPDTPLNPSPAGPAGVTAAPVPHASTAPTEDSAPVINSNSPTSPGTHPVASQENTASGPGLAQPTAMGLLKNLEGTAEAVIRSFHLEPEGNRSATGPSLNTEAVISKSTADELVEKVAAPGQSSPQGGAGQDDHADFLGYARQNDPIALSGGTQGPRHAAGLPAGSASTWAQALAERVIEMQQDKHRQLTLELDSKDLGRVLLRVQTEANRVQASISTESELARDMLYRDAPHLRQQLASQGLVLSQLSIDVQDHQGRRHDLQQRHEPRSKAVAGSRATSGAPIQWMAGGAVSSPGLPDQLINVFA